MAIALNGIEVNGQQMVAGGRRIDVLSKTALVSRDLSTGHFDCRPTDARARHLFRRRTGLGCQVRLQPPDETA